LAALAPAVSEPGPGRALVLAGGGVAGIAWEIGVLRGIEEADPALARSLLAADLVVGTSAGAVVGALVTTGCPLADCFVAQVEQRVPELAPPVALPELLEALGEALAGASDPRERGRRIGAVARAARTVPPAVRRAVIAARLPVQEWPERDLRVVAVDAETGERVVLERDSGVDLVDAVAASCAVPGVWPLVRAEDRWLMDGGVWSAANLDVAIGAERVLVLSPSDPASATLGEPLVGQVERFGPSRVLVVAADPPSASALGPNPLDPGTRPAAAQAGRAQGRRLAAAVAAFWAA